MCKLLYQLLMLVANIPKPGISLAGCFSFEECYCLLKAGWFMPLFATGGGFWCAFSTRSLPSNTEDESIVNTGANT